LVVDVVEVVNPFKLLLVAGLIAVFSRECRGEAVDTELEAL
jgi:hypothetical protein